MSTISIPRLPAIEYPSSDGQPMAESDFQLHPLIYAVESLKAHFQNRSDVYVAGNLFLYYEEGNPASVVAPDVFVVIGADNHPRDSYLLWNEPKAPDFILEITSRSTRSRDQGTKRGLYEYLGVAEYFCFDPTFDYLDPPLRGYRLQAGRYAPISHSISTATQIVLDSESLGLTLQLRDGEFRFVEPKSGRVLVNYVEAVQQLAEEQAARQQAEARLKELEAKLAAISVSPGRGNGTANGS